MSEIIRKIEATATGKKYATLLNPLVEANFHVGKNLENPFLTEYFVGVKLGMKVKIEDGVKDQKEAAIRAVRKGLIDLIFGEFRPLLRKAEYTLYDRDFDGAKRAIQEIEKRMFYDDYTGNN